MVLLSVLDIVAKVNHRVRAFTRLVVSLVYSDNLGRVLRSLQCEHLFSRFFYKTVDVKMPKYTSKKKAAAKRKQTTVTGSISRDKRILKRWAVSGKSADYEKLRKFASQLRDQAPDYVMPEVLDQLANVNRRRLVEHIHNSPSTGDNWFLDGLAWLSHQMPTGKWKWATNLVRASLHSFKGDGLTEQDEDYAKLVDATYQDNRPELLEHWRRLVQYDTDYVSAWQNKDNHVLIAVRGTKMNMRDFAQDLSILATGSPIDAVSQDIRNILKNMSPDATVDLGSHSLGTSLALSAYEHDPLIKDRIRQTFLYNPAASPVSLQENVTEKYEGDSTVRYFISLSDPVSTGLIGTEGPVNVVYRTGNPLHPMREHDVASWYPGNYGSLQKIQLDQQNEHDQKLTQPAVGPVPAREERFTLSFGDDNFMQNFERQLAGVGVDEDFSEKF